MISGLFPTYPMVDAARMAAVAMANTARLSASILDVLAPKPWSAGALAIAQAEFIERTCKAYPDPGFGLTRQDGTPAEERELSADAWMRLTHFPNPSAEQHILILAPSSGHHPSLLRATVAALVERHDVAIVGWECASRIPLSAGRLDLDAMIDRILDAVSIYRTIVNADVHMLAVCQPAPLALVAAAILEKEGQPLASLTLMGGPIDTAAAPTQVSSYADQHPLAWFEQNSIESVPLGHAGCGRKVYPGFLQLASFIAMQPDRHANAMRDRFLAAWKRDQVATAKSDAFYDDYLAVADLPAEFYLDTLKRIFQDRDLACGSFRHHDRLIDPATITKTPILTIEGEADDICAPGQTSAALALAKNAPRSTSMVVKGVGHYGLFSGSRWRSEIAPAIQSFMRGE